MIDRDLVTGNPDADSWLAGGRRMTLIGRTRLFVRYRRAPGPALLMLHGFPTWSLDWQPVWERLASEDMRLLTLDFLGFGASDKPPITYSVFDQADLVQEALHAYDLRQVHILAHDYGTIVAQELIARFNTGKGRVEPLSVTFLNGGIAYDAYRPRPIQRLLALPLLGAAVAALTPPARVRAALTEVLGVKDALDDRAWAALWAGMRLRGGHRLTHRLIRYNAERAEHYGAWEAAVALYRGPLALVWGPEDPVSGRAVLDAARTRLPRARVFELPGVGHYPQLEAPQAVAQAVLSVVRGTGPVVAAAGSAS